jgi:arginine N-succinyltransferase
MLIARPTRTEDFESFKTLARLAGPGFTSLMVPDDRLAKKLVRSEVSFAENVEAPAGEAYLLMLEDSDSGVIVGMSGIKAKVGQNGPYFNYRLLRQSQASKTVKRHFDMDMMFLVNEYSGASEIGTLFVNANMRGTGAGRIISQSRYMLMASAPERFADTIISELRGHIEEDGTSKFWDAVGEPFFKMKFGEADEISARTDNEFIVDLMPRHPIYVDLLPQSAREVIGQVHPSGHGARRLLEEEGFVYERMIDIFDGGPSMICPREKIRTVRDSRVVTVHEGVLKSDTKALICNNKAAGFRSTICECDVDVDSVTLTAQAMQALEFSNGDSARIWVKS